MEFKTLNEEMLLDNEEDYQSNRSEVTLLLVRVAYPKYLELNNLITVVVEQFITIDRIIYRRI